MLRFRNPQIVGVLPPGHKIGKPAPLFQKIENATIAELKKKYAGKQEAKKEPPATNAKISSTTANDVISEKTVDNQDAASLEEAINKQVSVKCIMFINTDFNLINATGNIGASIKIRRRAEERMATSSQHPFATKK